MYLFFIQGSRQENMDKLTWKFTPSLPPPPPPPINTMCVHVLNGIDGRAVGDFHACAKDLSPRLWEKSVCGTFSTWEEFACLISADSEWLEKLWQNQFISFSSMNPFN